MSKTIKIGRIGFNEDSLKGITLTDAYSKFDYVRKDVVKQAHSEVNPKTKKKK
tara:strand:- start:1130 stop:1288 length:159 start_codon:yes stop_codon:yes gene_type:complete